MLPKSTRKSGKKCLEVKEGSESYGKLLEQYLEESGYKKETRRRLFITHFTGYQPCSGDHNLKFGGNSCMEWNREGVEFCR